MSPRGKILLAVIAVPCAVGVLVAAVKPAAPPLVPNSLADTDYRCTFDVSVYSDMEAIKALTQKPVPLLRAHPECYGVTIRLNGRVGMHFARSVYLPAGR